jgi:hypothetical protein
MISLLISALLLSCFTCKSMIELQVMRPYFKSSQANQTVEALTELFRLDQKWDMWAPEPPKHSLDVQIHAVFANLSTVVLTQYPPRAAKLSEIMAAEKMEADVEEDEAKAKASKRARIAQRKAAFKAAQVPVSSRWRQYYTSLADPQLLELLPPFAAHLCAHFAKGSRSARLMSLKIKSRHIPIWPKRQTQPHTNGSQAVTEAVLFEQRCF